MQYTINSLDIDYSLVDSYQALPPDFILNLDDEEDIPWTYDEYIDMLSRNLVTYLNDKYSNLGTFSLVSSHSPKFYNYTTDHAMIQVTSDLEESIIISTLQKNLERDREDYLWYQIENNSI